VLREDIVFAGQDATVVCDEKCVKAWGINHRPKVQLDPENEDDVVWMADSELGDAPLDPGTYEGGHAKPTCEADRMNKWCVRECERSSMFRPWEEVVVKDWSKRVANIPGHNVPEVEPEVYGMDFAALLTKDKSSEIWPRVVASNTFTAQTLLPETERRGVVSRSVVIKESEDGRRIVSFGWPWEYGAYIFEGYSPEVASIVEGTSLEQTARTQPDKCESRWMLDMGGGGQEVWLEPEEARRVFSWAKPYLLDDGHAVCSRLFEGVAKAAASLINNFKIIQVSRCGKVSAVIPGDEAGQTKKVVTLIVEGDGGLARKSKWFFEDDGEVFEG